MTTLPCNVSNRAHGLCNEPEIWRNEGIPRDGFETCSTYIERTYDRAQESNSWDGAPVHDAEKNTESRNELRPGDGFGATHEMSLEKTYRVVTRIHIQVEKYSSWYVVEVNAWVDAAGKNGMRREWEIRDNKTRQIITRARRETRRLSKMRTSEARGETLLRIESAMGEAVDDLTKIDKLSNETAESIRSGLAPRWSDMDANQDVNNVKYIGWILEVTPSVLDYTVPINVLEDYNLTSMTLEFRRECRQSNLLESLTHMEVIEAEETTNSESKTKADFRSTHS
ncbi:hypothetical protein MKW92_002157 [Papaver armeniacum]|nr:hypothetical protein MKW92_002157 [Papaver armeniacum]